MASASTLKQYTAPYLLSMINEEDKYLRRDLNMNIDDVILWGV
jgi:hypothetical protein